MYRAYVDGVLFFATDKESSEYKITSGKLKLSLGTSGSLSFNLPTVNRAYSNFARLKSYVKLYRGKDEQNLELIFSGRVYFIQKKFDSSLDISCEGLLAVLNDSIIEPATYNAIPSSLMYTCLVNHNAQVEQKKQIQFGQYDLDNWDQFQKTYSEYETTTSRLADLVSMFGGFMEITEEQGNLFLNWRKECTAQLDQTIDFGQNLLDITRTEDSANVVTAVLPLGARGDDGNRLTIESVMPNGEKIVTADQTQLNKFGYVTKVIIWDEVTTPSLLKVKAEAYLLWDATDQSLIKVSAVDLANAGYDVGHFMIGQKIRVTSAPNDIYQKWFDITELSLDLLKPQNDKLTLNTKSQGYIKSQASSSAVLKADLSKIGKTYAPRSVMAEAISTATSLISGNSGGYVIMHDSDNDGKPDELLIMDTPDISTAVKVWRFNNSGLGYSSSGYSGTYGLAMTINGAIVADMITTGTLNADLLRAGTIRGPQGTNSYWNLATGDLHIVGAITVDSMTADAKASLMTGTVSCYYRSTTNTAPSISSSTTIGTSDNVDNAWEYVMPRPKNGCYFFTCEKYVKSDGSVSFSTVRQLSNATYTSQWCAASDSTYIDGGRIYANSVTADKINVTDLSAFSATIGGWTISSRDIYKLLTVQDSTDQTKYTQYKPFLQAPESLTEGYVAFGVGKRTSTNSGQSYGAWTYPFYVNYNGYLQATNAYVQGTLRADGGYIGGASGWTITSGAIYNGVTSLSDDSHNGMYVGVTGLKNVSGSKSVKISDGYVIIKGSGSGTYDSGLVVTKSTGGASAQIEYNEISVYNSNSNKAGQLFCDYLTFTYSTYEANYMYDGIELIHGNDTTKIQASNIKTQRIYIDEKDGTTSSVGESWLMVGNDTESGNAENSRGRIRLYSAGSECVNFQTVSSLDSNRTISLPDQTGTVSVISSSDRRKKNELSLLSDFEACSVLNGVVPVNFTYKQENPKDIHTGIYAQDLKKALVENGIGYRSYLVMYQKSNDMVPTQDMAVPEDDVEYAVDYAKLVSVLIKGWQMHEARIADLEARL